MSETRTFIFDGTPEQIEDCRKAWEQASHGCHYVVVNDDDKRDEIDYSTITREVSA